MTRFCSRARSTVSTATSRCCGTSWRAHPRSCSAVRRCAPTRRSSAIPTITPTAAATRSGSTSPACSSGWKGGRSERAEERLCAMTQAELAVETLRSRRNTAGCKRQRNYPASGNARGSISGVLGSSLSPSASTYEEARRCSSPSVSTGRRQERNAYGAVTLPGPDLVELGVNRSRKQKALLDLEAAGIVRLSRHRAGPKDRGGVVMEAGHAMRPSPPGHPPSPGRHATVAWGTPRPSLSLSLILLSLS